MVGETYNPNTQEVEAGGLRVRGQTRLYSEMLSTKQNKKNL
jgi:hypothetical protein